MITSEENQLLTQTNRGTPAGELLRRYWQPVALSAELPMGGAPLAVRILGETLALFRDDQGRIGLLGLHCSHRGTDLSYGRIEDGGLRCLYHGWLYDIHGRCLEQPGEPGGGANRDAIQPSRLSVPGKGRGDFHLHGAGRCAVVAQLRISQPAAGPLLCLQSLSRVQLSPGQRGQHRSGAFVVSAQISRAQRRALHRRARQRRVAL